VMTAFLDQAGAGWPMTPEEMFDCLAWEGELLACGGRLYGSEFVSGSAFERDHGGVHGTMAGIRVDPVWMRAVYAATVGSKVRSDGGS